MGRISAGLLMCRQSGGVEFFLVHPGGPFWKNKDDGWWTIPKGLVSDQESSLQAACREFHEETGIRSSGPYHPLGEIKQRNGKTVLAWAFTGAWDAEDGIQSNMFTLEWPPRSGKFKKFPEVDQAGWFNLENARHKILPAQLPFLERAVALRL